MSANGTCLEKIERLMNMTSVKYKKDYTTITNQLLSYIAK